MRLTVVFGYSAYVFGEIEEAVIHLGSRLRTSLAGTVRPPFASRMPSSMAARVSSSSSSRMGGGLSSSNFLAFATALSWAGFGGEGNGISLPRRGMAKDSPNAVRYYVFDQK
jgi:hypothetical protein